MVRLPNANRTVNPGYRVPDETVHLATLLDLNVQRHQYRYRIDEWKGWHVLAPANASEAKAGYCRLYLVAGSIEQTESEPSERAARTYEEWHSRDPRGMFELETPETIGYYQGRVITIGYRSDKWTRRLTDYDHDFLEEGSPPKIYTSHPRIEQSTGAAIVGGTFRITNRGIV